MMKYTIWETICQYPKPHFFESPSNQLYFGSARLFWRGYDSTTPTPCAAPATTNSPTGCVFSVYSMCTPCVPPVYPITTPSVRHHADTLRPSARSAALPPRLSYCPPLTDKSRNNCIHAAYTALSLCPSAKDKRAYSVHLRHTE